MAITWDCVGMSLLATGALGEVGDGSDYQLVTPTMRLYLPRLET